jgi:hypothetical protein
MYASRMQIVVERKALIALAAVAVTAAGCGGSSHDKAPSKPAAAAAKPVSATAGTVAVPKIVGMEQGAAHRLVERAGLKMAAIGYVGKYGNGRYNVNCVAILSQSPVVGERRPRGAVISVIVHECKTPDAAPVPPAGTA